MSSPESLSSRESCEGGNIPIQKSSVASLVPYSSNSEDDDQFSVSNSETLAHDYLIDSNHNQNSGVCEKSNECDELASSLLNNILDKVNYPNTSLNTNCLEKESKLKLGENKLIDCAIISMIESPRNKNGNAPKAFNTPLSIKKTEMFKNSDITPLKRPFSVMENDDYGNEASFTPKANNQKIGENMDRWNSPNRYQSFSRKSLPAQVEYPTFYKFTTDRHTQNRRRSYPFSESPHQSPSSKQNFHNFRTDQTPYSPAQNQQKRRRFNLPYYDAVGLMSLESESGFIDSHCHLDFIFQRQNYKGTYSEYQKQYENTFPKSYRGCVAIFCNPFTFSKEDMWGKFLEEENVWASFGCHPHNAKDYNDDIEKSLYAALEHSKVRALGEIGLDYSNRNSCMKTTQFEVFRRQLKVALKKQLPVVIHCREAHEDAIEIIKEILPIDYTIHLHCFTDTWEWAQKWLNEFPNLCIGITNVVTFPSAESVHEVVKNIPLDRLLLETDAPYFIPKRGCQGMRWSHPGLAVHVAAQIAALRSIPIEEVFQATRRNTKRVYNI